MEHPDNFTQNEEQWQTLAQLLESRTPEGQMIVVQTDSLQSRDQWIEACASEATHLQHIGLDLSQEQVSSLSQVLESRFADVNGASEESPIQQVVHILHLETSFFHEILENESILLPSLEQEAEELTESLPFICIFWTDDYSTKRIQQEAPSFWEAVDTKLHFFPEEAKEEENPYELLSTLSQKVKDSTDGSDIDPMLEIGDVFGKYGRWGSARSWYEQGLELAVSQENPLSQSKAHERIGDLLVEDQDLGTALGSYEHALELLEETEQQEDLGRIQQRMGAVFLRLRNHQKALPFLQKAATQFDSVQAHQSLGDTYRQIAKAYEYKGEPASTIRFYESAADAYSRSEDGAPKELALTYQQLGAVHQNRHNWAQALESFQKALPNAQKIEDEFLISALEDSIENMAEKTSASSRSTGSDPKKKGWLGRLFG